MDKAELLSEFESVNPKQGQEQRRQDRTHQKSHHSEQADASEHGEENNQVVHSRAAAHQEWFEQIIHAANHEQSDQEKRYALPNVSVQQKEQGGRIHDQP